MKKKPFFSISFLILSCLISCNDGFFAGSQIKLSYNPSQKILAIDNFPIVTKVPKVYWSIGENPCTAFIGKGDDKEIWESIEKKIFNFLREQDLKTPQISVVIRYTGSIEDKYGNESVREWEHLGNMFVADIKQYRDFKYFKANGWSLKNMFESFY